MGRLPRPRPDVKLSDEEYEDWANARRDRDLLSHGNERQARRTRRRRTEKPKKVEDKQLAKALDVIKGKLAEASATAKE